MKSPLECLKRRPKDGHASSQCRGPRRAPVSFYCANIELYKHMSLIQPSIKTTRRFFFKKSERTDRYRSGFYLEGGVSDQIHMRATYPPTDHRDPLCVPSTTCAMCCASKGDVTFVNCLSATAAPVACSWRLWSGGHCSAPVLQSRRCRTFRPFFIPGGRN